MDNRSMAGGVSHIIEGFGRTRSLTSNISSYLGIESNLAGNLPIARLLIPTWWNHSTHITQVSVRPKVIISRHTDQSALDGGDLGSIAGLRVRC